MADTKKGEFPAFERVCRPRIGPDPKNTTETVDVVEHESSDEGKKVEIPNLNQLDRLLNPEWER